jgi:hypothetical protein
MQLRRHQTGTKYTLHWDGNDLALTTNSQNNASTYVENLAANTNGELVVYDRDFSGMAVEQHTKTGDRCHSHSELYGT